jgi:hypothetical protein
MMPYSPTTSLVSAILDRYKQLKAHLLCTVLAGRKMVAALQHHLVRIAVLVMHDPIDPRSLNLVPRLVQLLGGI